MKSAEQANYASRLRSSGQTPLMLTEAWVPPALGKRITAAQLRELVLYDILLNVPPRGAQTPMASRAVHDLAR